jgi:NAD(P)-dependent dehydrogenase (short-subunit alcohol dehydrogenase family)
MSTKTSGKKALITGGAKRVGRALALHLAQAGYDIAIHYHRSETEAAETLRELETFGVQAVAVQADFANTFDAEKLLDEAQRAIGAIDCLINSASVFSKDTLNNFTDAQFHGHMQVNLYAPLALIRAFKHHVDAHALQDASIINLGDGTMGWSYSSKFLSYTLSKGGLMQLSTLLAAELAPAIRINAIGLGPSLPGEIDDENMFARLAARSPLKRVSNTQEICHTVDYLLATPSITGQTILLNSGLHCDQLFDVNH